jgi:hypothetical protein
MPNPLIDSADFFLSPRRVAPRELDAVRTQVAIARALLDELERVTSPSEIPATAEQTIEQLARLGCRIFDAAARLAERANLGTPGLLAYD